MQEVGRESWLVASGSSFPVDVALYVRDALALPVQTDPAVPGLDPPVVEAVPTGVDVAAVAAEWPGWWTDVLAWCRAELDMPSGRARFESLPLAETSPALAHRPALRAALAALTEPAARYQGSLPPPQIPPPPLVGDVVRDLERELGRPARPFRLLITEVRVRGLTWERLTDQHVLAATRFLETPAARPALRGLILPLA